MRGLYLAAAAACALVAGQAGAAVTAVGGSVIVQGTLDTNNPGSSAAESFTGSVFQSLSKSIDLENADNTNDVDFLGSLVLKSASEGDLSGYAYAYNALVSTVPGPIDRTSEGYGAASYTFSIDRASYLKLDGDQTIITSIILTRAPHQRR